MPRHSGRLRRCAAFGVLLLTAACAARALRAQAPADTLSLYRRGLALPVDANGFLMNPRWLGAPATGPQAPVAADPSPPNIDRRCRFRAATGNLGARYLMVTRGPCLSADELQIVTLDEITSPMGSGFVCSTNSLIGDIHGHVNWFPVTVTGQLRWEGYSPLPGDQDFSFDLGNGPEPDAATSGNDRPKLFGRRPAYRVEFSHPETLQRLIAGGTDAAQAWWTAYGDSLERVSLGERAGQSFWVALFDSYANAAAVHRLVDGRVAVVTGLYGLDAVHAFQAELHPAYAMFVLVDTTRTAHGLREEWAFLVRNLGNEGDCSAGVSPMVTSPEPEERFIANLGTWTGAGAPRAYLGPTWSTDPGRVPAIESDTGGGALFVALDMPSPKADAGDYLAFGTLYVEWPRDGAGPLLGRFYDAAHPWLANRAVRVNLDTLDRPGPPPRNRLDDAKELLELPESSAVRAGRSPVVPVPPRALPVADSAWAPPDTVAAVRTIPLFPWSPVARGCDLEGADPICGSPVQLFAVGADAFDDLFLSPVYVYSRVLRVCGDECILGQILGTLAYRFDGSMDRFRRSCVRAPCTPTTTPGWSARVSPILNGNTFRLGKDASLAPYTIGSLGVSFLVGQRASPLLAVGFGLRLHTGYFDLFAEGQDDMRLAGRYENRWLFPVGVQLDFSNLFR